MGVSLPVLRAFLPSALFQSEIPNAIQMHLSSSTDLHRVGDSDIVTTPPSIQPHMVTTRPGNNIKRGGTLVT